MQMLRETHLRLNDTQVPRYIIEHTCFAMRRYQVQILTAGLHIGSGSAIEEELDGHAER